MKLPALTLHRSVASIRHPCLSTWATRIWALISNALSPGLRRCVQKWAPVDGWPSRPQRPASC